MPYREAEGRPSKVTWAVIVKLADSLQHNTTITEACRYAGISRSTYYRHLNNEDGVFAVKMEAAMKNQNKVVMSFVTI
jgi:ACT domain-containing protein